MASGPTDPPPPPAAATGRRRSAGEAELAAIDPDRGPTLKGRLLAPVAAAAVTVAVYGLLATSLATALLTRRDAGTA